MHKKTFKEKLNKSESKKSSDIPNYLILIENDGKISEIIPACTLTKTLEIVVEKEKNCTVLEKTKNNWEILLKFTKIEVM